MSESARRLGYQLDRVFRFVLLFCIVRIGVGLALYLIRDGTAAWGYEATVIVAGAVAVYLLVALAVRRWAPPRQSA